MPLTDMDLQKLEELAASSDLIVGSGPRMVMGIYAPLVSEHRRLRAAVRVILNPTAVRGALRLEDWTDWPEEQRRAFEELKALAAD